MTNRLRIAWLVATSVAVAACADDETTSVPEGPVSYDTVTPGGSFEDDVMPLFSRACALSQACHQGDPGAGIEGLGLGPPTSTPPTQMQIDDIHAALLSQAPGRSSYPFIEPGKPNESWLQIKIEYGADDLEKYGKCSGSDCGDFMPSGSSPENGLSREERDRIAAWILDGAQNN